MNTNQNTKPKSEIIHYAVKTANFSKIGHRLISIKKYEQKSYVY